MRTDFLNNPLIKKCFAFSIAIIQFVEKLEEEKKIIIARQFLKRAT
jgi:hypothetical protein